MTKYIIILILLFFIQGCSSKSLSPLSVSKEFWVAQKQERINIAKQLTIKEDAKKTKLYKKIKIRSIDYGEVKEDKDRATIATKLYLKGHKNIKEVDFSTELEKTDKGWRVNMDKTKKSLYFAISKKVTGNFGEILIDNLEGLSDILKDAMENFKEIIEKGAKK